MHPCQLSQRAIWSSESNCLKEKPVKVKREIENSVETLACGLCFYSISSFIKLPLVFLQLDRNTENINNRAN